MTPAVHSRPLFIALGALLALALWLSLALGPVSLPLGDTLRAALRLAGMPLAPEGLEQAELILGQGESAPPFTFATLYRVRRWRAGGFEPPARGRALAMADDVARAFV